MRILPSGTVPGTYSVLQTTSYRDRGDKGTAHGANVAATLHSVTVAVTDCKFAGVLKPSGWTTLMVVVPDAAGSNAAAKLTLSPESKSTGLLLAVGDGHLPL